MRELLTLSEISKKFDENIAKQCEQMRDGETATFHLPYEALIVSRTATGFFVEVVNAIDHGIELDEGNEIDDDFGIDF